MISVITATFNSRKTLPNTLKSVLCQNLRDFEFIVVDGKSSDRTIDIVKDAEPKFDKLGINYSWICEKDNGIYDAWNKGLELAKGEWITFLGSDDVFTSPDTLSNIHDILMENRNIDWAYSKINLIDHKGNVVRKINERWVWKKFKNHMYVPHAGSFHNRDYFGNYGNFDTQFKIAGDYELILRKKNKLKTKFIDLETVNMLNEGVSNKNIMAVFREESLAKVKHNIKSKYFCWIDQRVAYLKYIIRNLV